MSTQTQTNESIPLASLSQFVRRKSVGSKLNLELEQDFLSATLNIEGKPLGAALAFFTAIDFRPINDVIRGVALVHSQYPEKLAELLKLARIDSAPNLQNSDANSEFTQKLTGDLDLLHKSEAAGNKKLIEHYIRSVAKIRKDYILRGTLLEALNLYDRFHSMALEKH